MTISNPNFSFDQISPFFCRPNSLIFQFLEKIDAKSAAAVVLMCDASDSLTHCATYCATYEQLSRAEKEKMEKIALKSLPFHRSTKFMECCISTAIEIRQSECSILLHLMAHPLQTIREATFAQLRRQVSLIVEEISDHGDATISNKLHFLVSKEVLVEIVKHRIHDPSHLVATSAANIVTLLVTSQILWSDEIKEQLWANLEELMPFLETFQGRDENQQQLNLLEIFSLNPKSDIKREH